MEIEKITNLATDIISISYNEEGDEMIISPILNPRIIDANFAELEERISALEQKEQILG